MYDHVRRLSIEMSPGMIYMSLNMAMLRFIASLLIFTGVRLK
jgi:hypothetical protein